MNASQLGTSRLNALPTTTPAKSSINATETPTSIETIEASRIVAARTAATAKSPISTSDVVVVGRGHQRESPRLGASLIALQPTHCSGAPRVGSPAVVAGRRKLILVSNRGPVTYGRDESGERTARRGAGGLVTALRGLLSHHDVTWIASAMSEEDRVVAAEAGDQAVDGAHGRRVAVPAAPRGPRRGCVRPLLQRRLEPRALVPAALPLGSRVQARARRRGPARLGRRLRAGELGLRGGRARRARARARGGRLLPRLPPLPRAAARPRARARRAARALHPHPVAADGLLARAARTRPAARSTTACSRTMRSGSTRTAGS